MDELYLKRKITIPLKNQSSSKLLVILTKNAAYAEVVTPTSKVATDIPALSVHHWSESNIEYFVDWLDTIIANNNSYSLYSSYSKIEICIIGDFVL